MNGLILLNKPRGVTSFSALHAIKKRLGTTRVGHTGTLDKFAEGLLIVLCGGYTRLAGIFTDLHKSYRAVIRLGQETSTLDPEGEITAEGEIPGGGKPGSERIRAVLDAFRGTILQVPPLYSAVHVNGKRAYKYATRGMQIELKPRPVTVFKIEMREYTPPLLTLDVVCSRGTYVRSLARDIARELGTCGYVTGLARHGVGPFTIHEAVRPDEFRPELHLKPAFACMKRLDHVGCVTVDDELCAGVRYGAKLNEHALGLAAAGPGLYALFTREEKLMAVVEKTRESLAYSMVVKD
jgi:tRNA pseudouridine55 synthase